MKKSRKAALTAALFTAAFNMNGCVYGPPPESSLPTITTTQITETTEETSSSTSSATSSETTKKTETSTETETETTVQETIAEEEPTSIIITDEPITEEYKPEKDVHAMVYGPPPDLS